MKRQLALAEARTSARAADDHQKQARTDPLAHFRPKADSDYVTRLQGRELIKSRRHERLIREYGEWVSSRGFPFGK